MRYTPKRREQFLRMLAETGNVSECCRQLKIGREALNSQRSRDPEFAAQWAAALDEAADNLEREARRRAVEGTDEPVFHQGEICGYTRKYSDTLLIFLLKGCRPEIYRDSYNVRHTGKVDHGHEHHHVHESVSDTAAWIDGVLRAGEDLATPESLPH